MICITAETSDSDRMRASYEEECRKLQGHIDSMNAEISRLGNVYEECRSLWMRGDFQLLSETLDNEGCRFLQDLSKKLVWLRADVDSARRKLTELNKDLEEGVACPKCDGVGKIVAEKHYERSDKQIIPVVRMEECSCCKGAGKLFLVDKRDKQKSS